jgi:hypothetical protein
MFTASTIIFFPYLTSGIPGVKFYSLACCFIALLYVWKKRQLAYNSDPYPGILIISSAFITICYLISDFYSYDKATAVILVNCIMYFFFPYIFWHCIKSKNDLKKYLKYLLITFLIIEIYAIIEQVVGTNIYSEFVTKIGIVEGEIMLSGFTRLGIKIANSLLTWNSTLGCTSAFLFFVCFSILKKNLLLCNNDLLKTVFFLAPICVLFSVARSMYVVFAILCVSIYVSVSFSSLTNLGIFSALSMSFFTVAILLKNRIVILANTIINAPGSTAELRIKQLAISLSVYQASPIWGNGKNYIWNVVKPDNPLLHGAESIWFSLLVDYGFMGCLSYIFLVISCIVVLWSRNHLYSILPLAFILGKTMSIVMDVDLDMLLIFTILLLKINKFQTEDRSIVIVTS